MHFVSGCCQKASTTKSFTHEPEELTDSDIEEFQATETLVEMTATEEYYTSRRKSDGKKGPSI